MALPNNIPIPFEIDFIQIPVTNYRKVRTVNPDMIVLHIGEGSKAAIISQFKDKTTEVSSHFLVDKDGGITQFVNTSQVAYGNGGVVRPISALVASRSGQNPNDYTISIEHEGVAAHDITTAQYAASSKLVSYLCTKWDIPTDSTHIIRHREITENKTCPGIMDVEKIIRLARY